MASLGDPSDEDRAIHSSDQLNDFKAPRRRRPAVKSWGSKKKLRGWAPLLDSVQLPYKWLNSMVYGRYNELVNDGYNGL